MTFITVNSSLRNNVAKECMLLIMTVGIVQFFFFSFVSLDSTLSCFQNLYNPLQLHRVRDEGVRGVHITST